MVIMIDQIKSKIENLAYDLEKIENNYKIK